MCTDTQYPSVVKEEPAFLCTVSVYSLVYPVYVRVRLNICKIRDQPPLVHGRTQRRSDKRAAIKTFLRFKMLSQLH